MDTDWWSLGATLYFIITGTFLRDAIGPAWTEAFRRGPAASSFEPLWRSRTRDRSYSLWTIITLPCSRLWPRCSTAKDRSAVPPSTRKGYVKMIRNIDRHRRHPFDRQSNSAHLPHPGDGDPFHHLCLHRRHSPGSLSGVIRTTTSLSPPSGSPSASLPRGPFLPRLGPAFPARRPSPPSLHPSSSSRRRRPSSSSLQSPSTRFAAVAQPLEGVRHIRQRPERSRSPSVPRRRRRKPGRGHSAHTALFYHRPRDYHVLRFGHKEEQDRDFHPLERQQREKQKKEEAVGAEFARRFLLRQKKRRKKKRRKSREFRGQRRQRHNTNWKGLYWTRYTQFSDRFDGLSPHVQVLERHKREWCDKPQKTQTGMVRQASVVSWNPSKVHETPAKLRYAFREGRATTSWCACDTFASRLLGTNCRHVAAWTIGITILYLGFPVSCQKCQAGLCKW